MFVNLKIIPISITDTLTTRSHIHDNPSKGNIRIVGAANDSIRVIMTIVRVGYVHHPVIHI
jgi:hypothetical protein